MKKNKIISAITAMVLLAAIFMTGCNELDDIDEVVLDLDGTLYGDMNDTEEKNENETIVAFIFDGSINDGGYTQMHNNGRIEVEKMPGVTTIYKEKVKDEKEAVEIACEEFINDGATIIYGTSFGHMEGMVESAKKHPDIKFVHCSGYMTSDNMGAFFGKIYQMRYLTGIVAGSKTKKNEIGYVAAYPIPEVIRGINAFTIGARSVNPDVKVKVEWTYTWDDEELEEKTANKLIADGVDIIAQHQNTVGAQKAAAAAGIYSVGYNRDMTYANPEHLTAPIWNWGTYYTSCTQKILDNSWKPGMDWFDVSSGLVDIAPISDSVDDEIKKTVENEKEKLLNGEDNIFGGPLYDQNGKLMVNDGETMTEEQLYSMDWFVDGVEGSIE